MDMDFEIFKGKSFKDLCKDIYSNQIRRKEQIDILISDLRKFVAKIDDTIIIIPLIKSYIDAANVNDEHLIKLAAIIQKVIIAENQVQSAQGMGLSAEEQKSLLEEVEKERKDLNKELNKIMDSDAVIVKKIESYQKDTE
jgi:hypothetical protein